MAFDQKANWEEKEYSMLPYHTTNQARRDLKLFKPSSNRVMAYEISGYDWPDSAQPIVVLFLRFLSIFD